MRLTTLDQLVESDLGPGTAVQAIKIDVEGAELKVLRGAQRTLESASSMTIFLDIHRSLGVDAGEVCALLRGLGFKLYSEAAPFDLPIASESAADTLIAVKSRQGSCPQIEREEIRAGDRRLQTPSSSS